MLNGHPLKAFSASQTKKYDKGDHGAKVKELKSYIRQDWNKISLLKLQQLVLTGP